MSEPVRRLRANAAGEVADAERSAAHARTVVWIIFLVALVIGVGLRGERMMRVSRDLGPMIERINDILIVDPATSVADVQKALVAQLGSAEQNAGYAALVRVLAYHMKQTPDLRESALRKRLLQEIDAALFKNWLVLSLIHTGLLSIFPGSFMISVNRARARVRRRARAAGEPSSFREAVLYRRAQGFLEEEGHSLVWRRFAVFLLFSLGITYLMAPEGLHASSIGELLTIYPIPGDPTHPFWFAEFSRVQPFVLGLAGFLVYSLVVFAHGVVIGQLGNRVFLALWNRGITVVILSLVLSAMDFDAAILNALVFIAGVFPQTGIQAIAKLAQRGAEQAAALNPTGLSRLPQIDSFSESALRSLGILNVTDLAHADLEKLLVLAPIAPAVLLKAVDRAMLLDALGAHDDKLAKVPAHTASELVLSLEGRDAYLERWRAIGKEPAFHLAPALKAGEKTARLKQVNGILEVGDISAHVARLKASENFQFIVDNACSFADA